MTQLLEQIQQMPMEMLISLVSIAAGVAMLAAQEAVGMGFVGWIIGQIKGRPGGFLWGLWLGWIGIAVVLFRSAKKNPGIDDKGGDNPPARPDALELMDEDDQMWFCPGCGRAHPSAEDSCLCGVRKTSYSCPTRTKALRNDEDQQVFGREDRKASVMGELIKFFPVLPMEKETSKLIWSILFYIYVAPILFTGASSGVFSLLFFTLILAGLAPLVCTLISLAGTAYTVLGIVFAIMCYIGRKFD